MARGALFALDDPNLCVLIWLNPLGNLRTQASGDFRVIFPRNDLNNIYSPRFSFTVVLLEVATPFILLTYL